MGLHHLWFLHWWSLFLGLTQALQKGLLLAAQTTVQPPPLAGTVQLHQLLTAQGERLSINSITKFVYCRVARQRQIWYTASYEEIRTQGKTNKKRQNPTATYSLIVCPI